MINPDVVAAIRVVGVRGEPTTHIAATTPGLITRILNLVLFKIFKNFQTIQ